MLSPDFIQNCLDYQIRAGLKNPYFSVHECPRDHVRVIVSCETVLEDFIERDLLINVNKQRLDECVYRAVMMCADMLAAAQFTIH